MFDQFAFLERTDLEIISDETIEVKKRTFKHNDLFDTLMEEFSALPDEINLDDYAVINVSPSVVPNPFVPSFRIYSFNTTDDNGVKGLKRRNHGRRRGQFGDKEVECSKEDWQGSWKCHLNETWYSDPQSPSRSNQRWTPLGYAQVCGKMQE